MSFAIEKGIPAPRFRPKPGQPGIYPWRQMAVGDSFFVRYDERPTSAVRAAYAQARDGRQFVSKKVQDGVRIWRVR